MLKRAPILERMLLKVEQRLWKQEQEAERFLRVLMAQNKVQIRQMMKSFLMEVKHRLTVLWANLLVNLQSRK
jgi:hypothetical protein